jgi:eukaryotic-like serine/threonine-protein kinase
LTAQHHASTSPDSTASVPTVTENVATSLTSPGSVVGTVAYMSPEQVRGDDLDARSDLFSFGTVLYEMATARQPFSGATSGVISQAILGLTPVPVTHLNSAAPPDLDRILAKVRSGTRSRLARQ